MIKKHKMNITQNCIAIAQHFEGLKLTAYQDSGGVWTIGRGHTLGVKEGDTCTVEQAEQYFFNDMQSNVKQANFYLTKFNIQLNQNQFDSFVDLVYNRGIGNATKYNIFALMKMNPNNDALRTVWIQEGVHDHTSDGSLGELLPGLVLRRTMERDLYFKPII